MVNHTPWVLEKPYGLGFGDLMAMSLYIRDRNDEDV